MLFVPGGNSIGFQKYEGELSNLLLSFMQQPVEPKVKTDREKVGKSTYTSTPPLTCGLIRLLLLLLKKPRLRAQDLCSNIILRACLTRRISKT
jgi:hypothetical protein